MSKNIKLKSITPDMLVEGVNVYLMGTVLKGLFGENWSNKYDCDFDVLYDLAMLWIRHQGGHYYAEERWVFDADDRMSRGFSVNKGIREAKRFGARVVVCEDLS